MISNHIHLSETGRELSHQTEIPGKPGILGILAIQVFIALGFLFRALMMLHHFVHGSKPVQAITGF